MSKKFTSKPIRQQEKNKSSYEEYPDNAELDNFYMNNNQTIEKPKNNTGQFIIVALLALLFGFGGSMFYNSQFAKPADIDGSKGDVHIEKQENITVTNEERLAQVNQHINKILVNFYQKPNGTAGPFYQDKYSLGNGFILTSDGWIVTSESVIEKIGEKDYYILTSDYSIYEVQKTIEDPISSLVLVKIDANNLPVVKLANSKQLNSGQKVYGYIADYPYAKNASLHLADLASTELEDVVASTEIVSHFISAREGYNQSLFGSPIVNQAGEIVAVINNQSSAIRADLLESIVSGLKLGVINRVYFGVRYINLSLYPRVNQDFEKMRHRGALLSGYQDQLAVEKNSPADKAGLQVGDIITKVEDEIVNSKKTLTQIIQSYQPGDKLELTIIRAGQEKVVKVELRELK